MSKAMTIQPTANDKELQAEIERMFSEIDQIEERIQQSQERIDRLKSDTRSILAEIRA